MVWKMSIDLSRAQVPSMGKHDPLDGYITSLQLTATAAALPVPDTGPKLARETGEYARMIRDGDWTTDDPLGLGGLLIDAFRVQQLLYQGVTMEPLLLENLLDAAITGLHFYARSDELWQPARFRLAFRELGLAIGLQAVERMQHALASQGQHDAEKPGERARLDTLMRYTGLRDDIEAFWRTPEHQHNDTWAEHRDINEVMLASSLAPDGLLELFPPGTE